MAQAVLTSKGTVVPRRTMRKLTKAELLSEIEKKKRQTFDDYIKSKLGDSLSPPPHHPINDKPDSIIDINDPDLLDFDSLPSDTDPVNSDGIAITGSILK